MGLYVSSDEPLLSGGHTVAGLPRRGFVTARSPRGAVIYILELVIVGVAYFALANAGSTIAAIYSNAMPISTPAGVALAAVLLRGIRVWPALCVK